MHTIPDSATDCQAFLAKIFPKGGAFTTKGGGTWSYCRPKSFKPTEAQYYCTMQLDGDGHTRSEAHFHSLNVLVLDDVGVKGRAIPGLVPSYEVETSPGNYQVGYVLNPPITDMALARELVNRATSGGFSDPSGKGVNRLVRLPFGVNGKDSPEKRDWAMNVTRMGLDVRYSCGELNAAMMAGGAAGGGAVRVNLDDGVTEGGRNNRMTQETGRLINRGLAPEKIWQGLRKLNLKLCNPPLPDRELEVIYKSVSLIDAARKEAQASSPFYEVAESIGFKKNKDGEYRLVDNLLYKLLATRGPFLPQFRRDTFKGVSEIKLTGESKFKPLGDDSTPKIVAALNDIGFSLFDVKILHRALENYLSDTLYDSAQEWLLGLPAWDGVRRIDTFFQDVCGVTDTSDPYYAAVAGYYWTAKAGRVMEPGCRADMALVLVGAQDCGKTDFAKHVDPPGNHVTVNFNNKDNDTISKRRGMLTWEVAEGLGLSSRGCEHIKVEISSNLSTFIQKYSNFTTTVKWQGTFVITTNETEFLDDPTGERRFLPLDVGKIDRERLIMEREQLWAEGFAMFKDGGIRWTEAQRLAKEKHGNYKVTHFIDGYVEKVLDKIYAEKRARGERLLTTKHDIHEGLKRLTNNYQDKEIGRRLNVVAARRGWFPTQITIKGETKRYLSLEGVVLPYMADALPGNNVVQIKRRKL